VFYDPLNYPAAALLETHFAAIRSELQHVCGRFVPWPERDLYGRGWSVFGFYAFGRRLDGNCRLCPLTAQVLDQIGCPTQAGFSRLAPHTHIRPHCGRPKDALRCHLGLEIPPGDLALRVGDQVRHWQAGRCLLFDDTGEHEAWNHTDRERVVLLVDIAKDGARDRTGS
jgi:beta-hydroxylase